MFEIVYDEIVIATTPLEKIRFENDRLSLSFDDISLNRVHVEFLNILAFKSTYEDLWNVDLLCKQCFYKDEGNHTRYRRNIYEITDSSWIEELKKQGEDMFQEDFSLFHHYVLILGDKILEVICEKLCISDRSKKMSAK
ncbi:MAG: hypothetical protein K2J85_03155 [Anaeroplasmataceae bacterium]|nr:hypothetical protein [Anaeroplasmataceae bacterium]